MKERDKKEASGLAPLSILRWILLAPVNLGLILIVQAFFIHTQTAPLTSERLAAQPVFSGCEILDIAGTEIESSKLMLRGDRSWILYRNAAGENRVMRVEWNYVLPRYRLETSVDLGIPAGETSYTAAARDFLGKSAVTVEKEQIISYETSGVVRKNHILQGYVLLALGLILLEAGIYHRLRNVKMRKQRDQKQG